MSTKQYRILTGLALAALVAFGIVDHIQGQDKPAPGMTMRDMEMAKPGDSTPAPTTPPGYSEVSIAEEVQQRIGVTLGSVEQTPLTMVIRIVAQMQQSRTILAQS